MTNSSGQASVPLVAAYTGVAAFRGQPPVNVTSVSGGTQAETTAGGTSTATVAGASLMITVSGPPSTPCQVFYSVDQIPTNDAVSAAEQLVGRSGSLPGTTRAATRAAGEPAPTAGALRTVWYRWSGPTGTATFSAERQPGGGLTDPASGVTSVGVAVFDAASPTRRCRSGAMASRRKRAAVRVEA